MVVRRIFSTRKSDTKNGARFPCLCGLPPNLRAPAAPLSFNHPLTNREISFARRAVMSFFTTFLLVLVLRRSGPTPTICRQRYNNKLPIRSVHFARQKWYSVSWSFITWHECFLMAGFVLTVYGH